jgi:hypothetical protein
MRLLDGENDVLPNRPSLLEIEKVKRLQIAFAKLNIEFAAIKTHAATGEDGEPGSWRI